MNEEQEKGVVADLFDNYNDTQREVLAIMTRKTRNKLIAVAIVALAFNMLAIAIAKIPLSLVLWSVIAIPIIFIGLAALSVKEPLVAAALGCLVVFGVWIYNAVALDVRTLLQGWLGKIILVYLLFAALQDAKEAHRIKRELNS